MAGCKWCGAKIRNNVYEPYCSEKCNTVALRVSRLRQERIQAERDFSKRPSRARQSRSINYPAGQKVYYDLSKATIARLSRRSDAPKIERSIYA